MGGAISGVLVAMLLLVGVTLFFGGFVLAPLIALGIGYLVFAFARQGGS
jgi:hypothetical protein